MTEPGPAKGSILLAGAESELTGAVGAALRARGYQVHEAATGCQALKLAHDTPFDILLVSNNLHDLDACQFCQRIKEAETNHSVPVLVLCHTNAVESIQELLAAGAADVLMIPLGLPLILTRIDSHLQLLALESELARRDVLLKEEAATRRQVEESVRVAEVSGRELVENLSEVIYAANVDGILTYVSPGIGRLLGYTPQEVIGRHVSDFVHPEAHNKLAARIERVAAGQREANEYRFVTKTGETRWAQSSSQPILDDGQVVGMQGVLTDITERKQAGERIRQQNEFLTTVIESLTHPFYVLNVDDYTIQMANTAAQVEGPQGSATCYTLTHRQSVPCDSSEHPCPIEELRKTGKPVRVEHVHYDPGGRERFVEVYSYPLFDEHGWLVRAIEYTLDITDRKLAEQSLRESEARWRSVTENSPDHVILLDRDLNIQFVNYPSPGLTIDELLGTPLYAYVSEEQQHEVKQVLEHVLETAKPASYETTYTMPDGNSIHYESRVVSRVVEGELVGLALNARDITEHKRAEQALRAAMQAAEQARQAEQARRHEADQRRRVAESLAGVMAALNSNQPLDRVLDHIAAQARKLLDNDEVAIYSFSETGDELILQAAQGSIHTELPAIDRACKPETVAHALASRQPLTIKDLGAVYSEPGNGSSTPFRALLVMPVTVQGEIYGGLVMCSRKPRSFGAEEVELAAVFSNQVALAVESARLRSEREQTAAATERNRIARDLHDSVTQALFSATLVAEVLPQVAERDPELAREGLLELGTLTRGALAEMRTMLLELRPTAVVKTRLSDLIRQLTDAVTSRVGLLASYNIEPSPILPADVHVTYYRIAQEALNNVLKHAEASRVTVGLAATPPVGLEAAGDWQGQIMLTVTDDGRGFEQRDLEPDQLGLGIMRERAETINAELSFDSQPGKGTCVTLMWPLEDTTADE